MKNLGKKCIIGTLIVLMTIGVVTLKPPQKAHAYWYDNGIDYYNAYGVNNQMVYYAGYFYFGGRSKLADDATNTTKYRTVGYKLTISTATQTVAIAIPATGNILQFYSFNNMI